MQLSSKAKGRFSRLLREPIHQDPTTSKAHQAIFYLLDLQPLAACISHQVKVIFVSLIACVLSNHYWATQVCPRTPCSTSESHLLLPWPDRKSYTWELLQPDAHCPRAVSSMHGDAVGAAPSVFLFCKGWRSGGGVQGCGSRHCLCCTQRVVHTAPSPTELFIPRWDSQSMSQRKEEALPLLACSGHFPCHDQKEARLTFQI